MIQNWMVDGLDSFRKRGALVEVEAEATEEEAGEVRAIEARAGTRTEEAKRGEIGRDLKLPMKRAEAGAETRKEEA